MTHAEWWTRPDECEGHLLWFYLAAKEILALAKADLDDVGDTVFYRTCLEELMADVTAVLDDFADLVELNGTPPTAPHRDYF